MLLYLAVGFVILLTGSWMSYTSWVRQAYYYPAACCVIGLLAALNWSLAVRHYGPDQQDAVYRYSLYFDVLMLVAYYLLPSMLAGVRLGLHGWLGAVFVLVGVALVKMAGDR